MLFRPTSSFAPPGHAGAERHGGFTLVEVLMVVAIIGIAGVVVVPQMLRTGSLTIQAAGRVVIADLLYAQNEAIARQAPRRVIFNPESNSYRLADSQDQTLAVAWREGGSTTQNYAVNFATDPRFAGVRLGDVAFSGSQTIEFDVLGSPNSGGAIDLVTGDTRYRISVAPITGRVTIAPVVDTGD